MGYLDFITRLDDVLPQPIFNKPARLQCPLCPTVQSLKYCKPIDPARYHLVDITCPHSGTRHVRYYRSFSLKLYLPELNSINSTSINIRNQKNNTQAPFYPVVSPYIIADQPQKSKTTTSRLSKKRRGPDDMGGRSKKILKPSKPCNGVIQADGTTAVSSGCTSNSHAKCSNHACSACCRYAGVVGCGRHAHRPDGPLDSVTLPVAVAHRGASNKPSTSNAINTTEHVDPALLPVAAVRRGDSNAPSTSSAINQIENRSSVFQAQARSQAGRRTGGVISAAIAEEILVGLKTDRAKQEDSPRGLRHIITLIVWFGPDTASKPEMYKFTPRSWPTMALSDCKAFNDACEEKFGSRAKSTFKLYSEDEDDWVNIETDTEDEYDGSINKILVIHSTLRPELCMNMTKFMDQIQSRSLISTYEDAMNIFPFIGTTPLQPPVSLATSTPDQNPPLSSFLPAARTTTTPPPVQSTSVAHLWAPCDSSTEASGSRIPNPTPAKGCSLLTTSSQAELPVFSMPSSTSLSRLLSPNMAPLRIPNLRQAEGNIEVVHSRKELDQNDSPGASDHSTSSITDLLEWPKQQVTNEQLLQFLIKCGSDADSSETSCQAGWKAVWGRTHIWKKSTAGRWLRYLRRVTVIRLADYIETYPQHSLGKAQEFFDKEWQLSRNKDNVKPKPAPAKNRS